MSLPSNRTKIVATIGPASSSLKILEEMIGAGMNVARLNFSHGDFSGHERTIGAVRVAAHAAKRTVAIMADLPGPKIRIGDLEEGAVEVRGGDPLVLTTENVAGSRELISVNFGRLPQVVKAGDALFLNDGSIELEVEEIVGTEVRCRVRVGGELRSRKGLNLPGIKLGIPAFTGRDRECLRFALEQGVDAVSQSFVESADDVKAVRQAAADLGHSPFIIAKIERAGALENIDEIVESADGIMIARGDLGVEIPIESMAVIQKQLTATAVRKGKPVITATQMLESMTSNPRPTRAEATDVANAVLDGTDCVMLSGESATGNFPVQAVEMMARIASATEPHRTGYRRKEVIDSFSRTDSLPSTDLVALSVAKSLEHVDAAAVIVPTVSGATARSVTRFRIPVWIAAVSPNESTCRTLQFSYGVEAVHEASHLDNWNSYARDWVVSQGLEGDLAVLTEGPSSRNPDANHRLELIDLVPSEGAP